MRFAGRGGSFSDVEDSAKLANYVQDIPERYVPALMRGQLVEAEHVGRYLWASPAANGRSVLDAGCGMAYGSAILADAGARAVIGVDVAEGVLETARPMMPDNVELQIADLRQLPFADQAFGLVVCFEVIEHVEDAETVLAELARVVAPDGILLVSSPNREVYPSGNPHHLHELTPRELEAALRRRFDRVALVVQHPFSASLIAREATTQKDLVTLERCNVHRATGVEAGEEAYTVAMASNAELPTLDDVAVLAGALEFRRWLELFDAQRAGIEALRAHLAEAESVAGEREQILRQLSVSEQLLAEMPELRDRAHAGESRARELGEQIDALHDEITTMRDEINDARRTADRARGVVEDIKVSLSWRVTAPLRRIKRVVRGGRR